MSKKPTPIIGKNFNVFLSGLENSNQFNLQQARLIPFYKPGDEMALTSILLSGLRLIKEFKKTVFKTINLNVSGKIHIFSEVEFTLFDNRRIDGLILIERGGKVIDGVIIEVKNKSNELDPVQISNYVQIAKAYKIPKILTISNQFVNFPTQSPVNIKTPKSVSLYHFSWSYLLTIAHILLIDNKTNISDEDQIEIMKEIVNYFESPKSGILGFTQMKPGWSKVAQKINAGASLKLNDGDVDETVSSWIEEERDMALILSRQLGLMVKSGIKKYKSDIKARIDNEKRCLVKNKYVEANLQIDGAVSDMVIRSNFGRKNAVYFVSINPPEDRKAKSQITWLKNQILKCEKKNPELYSKIKNGLMFEISLKFVSKPLRIPIAEIEDAHEKIYGREIKNFNVLYVNYLGKKFESRKLFVTNLENGLINFYETIVQYLKNWEKPPPKLKPVELQD
tara:strand:+ start:147 stop:1499 length:1353 start_codon:yes stop_codon:yes gene_type:complete